MEEKHFCRNCKGLRNHKSIHEVKTSGSDESDVIQWIRKYYIIKCLGCETISFLEVYGDTEMIEYNRFNEPKYYFENQIYPLYLEKSEELQYLYYIPEPIDDIYRETISAFKANSFILTAGGLRAIIEAVCNHLKIKKGNLADRIDLLHQKGHLSLNESKRLHSIRFLGNDALHEIVKPKRDDLFILLDIVNHLLSNLFINDKKMKGKLDMIIDKYDDFSKLFRNRIHKSNIGDEFTLIDILGKSIRLIPKKEFKNFEEEFQKEILSGNIDYVSIVQKSDKSIYRIEKKPEILFDW